MFNQCEMGNEPSRHNLRDFQHPVNMVNGDKITEKFDHNLTKPCDRGSTNKRKNKPRVTKKKTKKRCSRNLRSKKILNSILELFGDKDPVILIICSDNIKISRSDSHPEVRYHAKYCSEQQVCQRRRIKSFTKEYYNSSGNSVSSRESRDCNKSIKMNEEED